MDIHGEGSLCRSRTLWKAAAVRSGDVELVADVKDLAPVRDPIGGHDGVHGGPIGLGDLGESIAWANDVDPAPACSWSGRA